MASSIGYLAMCILYVVGIIFDRKFEECPTSTAMATIIISVLLASVIVKLSQ